MPKLTIAEGVCLTEDEITAIRQHPLKCDLSVWSDHAPGDPESFLFLKGYDGEYTFQKAVEIPLMRKLGIQELLRQFDAFVDRCRAKRARLAESQ